MIEKDKLVEKKKNNDKEETRLTKTKKDNSLKKQLHPKVFSDKAVINLFKEDNEDDAEAEKEEEKMEEEVKFTETKKDTIVKLRLRNYNGLSDKQMIRLFDQE